MNANDIVKTLTPAKMAQLSTLTVALRDNPKTRAHFAHLVRQVAPRDAEIAFQDVFVRQELVNFKKSLDDERLKERVDRAAEQRQTQKSETQKSRSLSDEQMGDLQKIQDQYGFSDWNAAADIYAQRNPPENPYLKPPPEIQEMGSTWEFPTVPGPDGKMLEFKDYIKNPRKYSNNIALQMITDFKRGKLPAAFAR